LLHELRMRSLLSFPFVCSLLLVGCADAGEDPDDLDDVDGNGKADGISSTSAERLLDAPFYFGVPKAAVTAKLERTRYPYPTVWNKSLESSDVGLRIIAVKQGATLENRKSARREMAKKLASAGVLQDGDIVLTFRPELAGTMAYPHIQMGATHAGLVYTEGGVAYNLDSPLDTQYNGQFDSSHYAGDGARDAGTDALHIVRPLVMSDVARRDQFRTWVRELKTNLAQINGERAQIKFQSDYLVPQYVAKQLTTRQTVTLLGKIILEDDTTTKLPMYCSEFAWHMIALSSCSADEITNAGEAGAACVDEAFAPMPLVASTADQLGLAEGPLVALGALPADTRVANVAKIFATKDAAALSSGHRMVSEQVAPLMEPLSQIYTARASGVPIEATAEGAALLSANVPANYSPTTFLVQAMPSTANRAMDYVATIAFVNAATYDKAKALSAQPVP